MTEAEAIARLAAIVKRGRAGTYADAAACRMDADEVLLAFLRARGHSALVDAWEEVRDQCWYPYS